MCADESRRLKRTKLRYQYDRNLILAYFYFADLNKFDFVRLKLGFVSIYSSNAKLVHQQRMRVASVRASYRIYALIDKHYIFFVFFVVVAITWRIMVRFLRIASRH